MHFIFLKDSKGFSLIEMMMVLFLFSLLAVSLFQTLLLSLAPFTHSLLRIQLGNQLRVVRDIWHHEFDRVNQFLPYAINCPDNKINITDAGQAVTFHYLSARAAKLDKVLADGRLLVSGVYAWLEKNQAYYIATADRCKKIKVIKVTTSTVNQQQTIRLEKPIELEKNTSIFLLKAESDDFYVKNHQLYMKPLQGKADVLIDHVDRLRITKKSRYEYDTQIELIEPALNLKKIFEFMNHYREL